MCCRRNFMNDFFPRPAKSGACFFFHKAPLEGSCRVATEGWKVQIFGFPHKLSKSQTFSAHPSDPANAGPPPLK